MDFYLDSSEDDMFSQAEGNISNITSQPPSEENRILDNENPLQGNNHSEDSPQESLNIASEVNDNNQTLQPERDVASTSRSVDEGDMPEYSLCFSLSSLVLMIVRILGKATWTDPGNLTKITALIRAMTHFSSSILVHHLQAALNRWCSSGMSYQHRQFRDWLERDLHSWSTPYTEADIKICMADLDSLCHGSARFSSSSPRTISVVPSPTSTFSTPAGGTRSSGDVRARDSTDSPASGSRDSVVSNSLTSESQDSRPFFYISEREQGSWSQSAAASSDTGTYLNLSLAPHTNLIGHLHGLLLSMF